MSPQPKLRVACLTGAGVSADSGLGVFRGPGGTWEGRRPEDVATPEAWASDPSLVWRFYQERRAKLRDVEPNPAHRALAQLESELEARGALFTLISQNVDDLHQRAGSTPIAVHGSLIRLRCEECGVEIEDRDSVEPAVFVPCPSCENERLRPAVVWFGEQPRRFGQAQTAAGTCTHFLVIGTSGAVYPAAGLLALARASGARTVVFALEEPDNLHPQDEFLAGAAAETVPRWVTDFLHGEA